MRIHIFAGIALLGYSSEMMYGHGFIRSGSSQHLHDPNFNQSTLVDFSGNNQKYRPSINVLPDIAPFENNVAGRVDAEGHIERHDYREDVVAQSEKVVRRPAIFQRRPNNTADYQNRFSRRSRWRQPKRDVEEFAKPMLPAGGDLADGMQDQSPQDPGTTSAPLAGSGIVTSVAAMTVSISTTNALASSTALVGAVDEIMEQGTSTFGTVADLLAVLVVACLGGALFRCLHMLISHSSVGANEGPQLARSNFDNNEARSAAKAIGYIGSPANLQNDAMSKHLHALAKKLQQLGHQLYVGPPNSALQHDGVQVQDMNDAAVDMFDIVLITPGGPGAQKEAVRFEGHADIFTFVNSADDRFGSPDWMKKLKSANTYDFRTMHSIEDVVQAVGNVAKRTKNK